MFSLSGYTMKSRWERVFYFSLGFILSCFIASIRETRFYQNTADQSSRPVQQIQRERLSNETPPINQPQRKILLDCGGNVGSTVKMFRETYPDGKDFIIHSFEIDDRLAPYFSPYDDGKHHLHCPTAVSDHDGNMTAFCDSTWKPNKLKIKGQKMQWGGGSMFVNSKELADTKTGGWRLYSYRKTVPTVNLSKWIQENTRKEDYVIFKMDIQGGEFCVLDQMLKDGTFEWIDKYYGEYHMSHPVGYTKEQKKKLVSDVEAKIGMVIWEGEFRNYNDFDQLHPLKIPTTAPGSPGVVYGTCTKSKNLVITIEIGMSKKQAVKVMSTLANYKTKVPVTVFIYSDFAVQWPELVKSWATKYNIGLRGTHHYPMGHFQKLSANWMREAVVTSEMRLNELGIIPEYFLSTDFEKEGSLHPTLKSRGFRIIQPASNFPPKNKLLLSVDNYYKYPDFSRSYMALEYIYTQLEAANGGILSLDTDHPDTHMISVFLLDYLFVNSEFTLTTLQECITT